ncbi:hypothetical protein [Streptomyces sp. ATCC 21386]|uniref:hypothetical protein n=1 Tax=Streptomyces sp. ATCC 21386 TaxID=2699428 RepID=UPI001BFFACB6|nr:hypothetical protein [Streptomyces sp. ATCC 21386]
MGLGKNYAHRPERDLWHDYEWGNVHWYCCGNPLDVTLDDIDYTDLMARRLTGENTLSWREPFIDRPVWVEASGGRAVTRAVFPLVTREFGAAPVSSVTKP